MTVKELTTNLRCQKKSIFENPQKSERPYLCIAEKNGVKHVVCKEILMWRGETLKEIGEFEVVNEFPTDAETEEVKSKTN